MGAVDLVIQVESPKSVARGLQRVGRAGPRAALGLEGADLPEVPRGPPRVGRRREAPCGRARSRRRGSRATRSTCSRSRSSRSAPTRRSRSTSSTSSRGARTRSRSSRARSSRTSSTCSPGRYPSDEFAELRPRIVWDRTAGAVRGRTGARRLAVTNAGTIPDRGLFGVFLVDGGGRVGELDEEMVYEAREGQTFLLGASTWRIEEITRDRVLVSPAPGVPGVAPFWKGEGVGRPAELGERIGRASRELVALADERRSSALEGEYGLDRARRAQPRHLPPRAGGRDRCRPVGPADRRRALPRRDRRLARLHPHAVRRPRARALGDGARARGSATRSTSTRSRSGRTTASRSTSRTPTCRRPSPTCCSSRTRSRISCSASSRSPRSSARGSARTPAARSLIPRRRPGQRTPLWQQRLKAQSLLQVARRYPQFPIVLETYRECLQDVFDLPALRGILRGIQTRALDLVEVETPSASPFASSLLFDYVATYMYEDDTPPEERRAQALSLDRELLRELMGIEELRELLDAGAIEQVEARSGRAPRNVDELHDLLRRAGHLRRRRVRPRASRRRCCASGARSACGSAASELLVAVEDAGARTATRSASCRPAACPRSFLEPVADALARCAPRYAKTHGPFTTARGRGAIRARRRLGSRRELRRLEREDAARPRGAATRAAASASGATRTSSAASGARRSPCCVARSSRRSRRRSVASCPRWHGIGRRQTLREALVPLQAPRAPGRALGERRAAAPRARRTARRSSTRSARRARSSGSAPGSTGSPSTSARMRPSSAAPAAEAPPEGVGARRGARRTRRTVRSSGPISSRRRGSTPPRCWRRSGISSGRAR